MNPTLDQVEDLARRAGEILRSGFGQNHQVDFKGELDLVTEMDRRSEAFLIEQIHRRHPGHSVVAEESGLRVGDPALRWYIDPLDGTINYTHGVPIFTVSIAFARAGQLALGVVYDPMQDECFSAELGRGARLNGRTIQVSKSINLSESLLVTGFSSDIRTNPANNLDHYRYFSTRSRGVRRLGSAALDLSYVAAGRLDGYWELRINDWDVAAGSLLVQEAGGVVSDLQGEARLLGPGQSILASNPHLHPVLQAGLAR
jgi:myo-inositol-1(or 4)-monophosphatase